MAKMSKRKARRLRRAGSVKAPLAKIGFGRLYQTGAGTHKCKKRKAIKRLEAQAVLQW